MPQIHTAIHLPVVFPTSVNVHGMIDNNRGNMSGTSALILRLGLPMQFLFECVPAHLSVLVNQTNYFYTSSELLYKMASVPSGVPLAIWCDAGHEIAAHQLPSGKRLYIKQIIRKSGRRKVVQEARSH